MEERRIITKERCADVVVLDMLPLLDTRTKDRGLTSSFAADLVIQIFSYVSEKERLLNYERQQAEIAAAKAHGVQFGGEPKKRPALHENLYK
jgi:DNA invertase Pin-like site-specific DNA recombinase